MSNSNNILARTVESSVAQLYSLLLSKEEYQNLLCKLNIEANDSQSTGAARRLLVPNPDLLDSALTDDLLTYEANTHPSKEPFVHSFPRVVRSNTRFFLKLYLLILGVKNGRAIYRNRGSVLDTIRSIQFKDGSGAKAAFALAGISLSYKLIYRLLLLLQDYLSPLLNLIPGQDEKLQVLDILRKESNTIAALSAALISGSMFQYFPRNAGRDVVAVYAMVRAAEIVFNHLDDNGYLPLRPKSIGAWALYPFAFSQLFHSFFFNPETNGAGINKILYGVSSDFFPTRPSAYSLKSPWPVPEQIVEGIAQVSARNFPKFKSPSLFPEVLIPDYLEAVKPVVLRAHPKIKTLTGAMTHPFKPSFFTAFTEAILSKYSTIGKYVLVLFLVKEFLGRNKTPQTDDEKPLVPKSALIVGKAITDTLKTTSFIVLSTSTAWAGIEASQTLLSPSLIPMHRYKLIGFLAGLWAYVDKTNGRGRYMYAVRAAILSYWRVLVKEKRIQPLRNGDVYLFVASFAVIMSLFERSPESISGAFLRKILFWIKNDDFKDPVTV